MKLISLKTSAQKGFIALLVIYLLVTVPAWGQSSGDYDLSWSTIDGDGGVSSGGDFTLKATIGQADAGVMTGGDYEMFGGFLAGVPVCIVDFGHFARFASKWLEMGCNDQNDWCNGADLNHMDDVGLEDLSLFVEEWLSCCPVNWPLK